MFSNLVAALAVASLATANPLIARQAADSVSAPQPTLVTTTIAGTCITPWLTASLKAGKAKTINLTKTVKTSSIAVVTTTKTATVTPSYISTIDYTVISSSTVTVYDTVTPPAFTVLPGALQQPINATEQFPSKNKRDSIEARKAKKISSSSFSATFASTSSTSTSVPVVVVSGTVSSSGFPGVVTCPFTAQTTHIAYKTVAAKKIVTVTAVPVAAATTSIQFTNVTTATVTSTVVGATPTFYAACDASQGYTVTDVEGYPVEAFAKVPGATYRSVCASCPYECCAACQQDPTCLFSFYDLNYNTCTYAAGNYTLPIAWYVGAETEAYDSLAMSGGPAGDMSYCGFIPGCEMVKGELVCPQTAF